jgi:hypothetical protein
MGVIDISPAMERFADKVKSIIPPCQDPEKQICHNVKLKVARHNNGQQTSSKRK